MQVCVEVCAGGVVDACAAAAAGADRIELCAALELGGLTPSIGVVEAAHASQPLPIVAMNRPRAGGFCYDDREFDAMLRDAPRLVAAGAAGVVFGILHASGAIDVERCRRLREAIGDAQAVFHKAFDFVPDLSEALEQLVDVGVQRVLTSGGRPTARDGAATLRALVEQAAGRITILPGGGVDADNVASLLAATGCAEVHVGVSGPGGDGSVDGRPDLPLADLRWLGGGAYRRVDPSKLEQLLQRVRAN